MNPVTRNEIFLAAAGGGDVPQLTPVTREEMFLAKAAGFDVRELEPKTQKEIFLSKLSGGGGGGGTTEENWFDDGNTHIWINLVEGRTNPMVGICVKGTATVDWGDGTEPDILTGTIETTTTVYTPNHQYASAGDYVITLYGDGNVGVVGNSSNGCTLVCFTSSPYDNLNNSAKRCIKRVEIGTNVTFIGNYAFQYCSGMVSAKIHSGATSIGSKAFSSCAQMTSVEIPDSVTEIKSSAFETCSRLATIKIPNSVTSIASNAFYGCYGAVCYDFTQHTAVPPLSDTNVFRHCPSDCQIRVPSALVDEWKAATNWSTYADYIVGV